MGIDTMGWDKVEAQWNVNMKYSLQDGRVPIDKVEAQWNVNVCTHFLQSELFSIKQKRSGM